MSTETYPMEFGVPRMIPGHPAVAIRAADPPNIVRVADALDGTAWRAARLLPAAIRSLGEHTRWQDIEGTELQIRTPSDWSGPERIELRQRPAGEETP